MSPRKHEKRYDNVRGMNGVDSMTIKGHDAIKEYVEREQKMLTEHGASIIFQVYRLNLHADTIEKLQGEKLYEIKLDGSFVSNSDTVAVVKDKVRNLLKELDKRGNGGQQSGSLAIDMATHLTLYLSGRPLQDETEFYADNYIILPVWIQVLLHNCGSDEAVQLINKFQKK